MTVAFDTPKLAHRLEAARFSTKAGVLAVGGMLLTAAIPILRPLPHP
jgi:hypothetical protein